MIAFGVKSSGSRSMQPAAHATTTVPTLTSTLIFAMSTR
jgi:hypothetical protein